MQNLTDMCKNILFFPNQKPEFYMLEKLTLNQ